jgi:hypothetical protein
VINTVMTPVTWEAFETSSPIRENHSYVLLQDLPFHTNEIISLSSFFQNAHKHYISGWFANKAKDIIPANGWGNEKRLVSFVDFGAASIVREDDAVIL